MPWHVAGRAECRIGKSSVIVRANGTDVFEPHARPLSSHLCPRQNGQNQAESTGRKTGVLCGIFRTPKPPTAPLSVRAGACCQKGRRNSIGRVVSNLWLLGANGVCFSLWFWFRSFENQYLHSSCYRASGPRASVE